MCCADAQEPTFKRTHLQGEMVSREIKLGVPKQIVGVFGGVSRTGKSFTDDFIREIGRRQQQISVWKSDQKSDAAGLPCRQAGQERA